MDQKLYNITLALAGIFQPAILVRDIAKNGIVDEKAFSASINSIYKIDAPTVADVFGGENNLRIGLLEICRLFGNEKLSGNEKSSPPDAFVSRYIIGLFHLERKLFKNPEMTRTLARRINYAVSQAKYFSDLHPTVMASLADIYLNTLGTFPYRIQVMGQAKILSQSEVVNKIRALLLAGVRATVLWRQVGGKRWQLFFWRSKLAQLAKKILNK